MVSVEVYCPASRIPRLTAVQTPPHSSTPPTAAHRTGPHHCSYARIVGRPRAAVLLSAPSRANRFSLCRCVDTAQVPHLIADAHECVYITVDLIIITYFIFLLISESFYIYAQSGTPPRGKHESMPASVQACRPKNDNNGRGIRSSRFSLGWKPGGQGRERRSTPRQRHVQGDLA